MTTSKSKSKSMSSLEAAESKATDPVEGSSPSVKDVSKEESPSVKPSDTSMKDRSKEESASVKPSDPAVKDEQKTWERVQQGLMNFARMPKGVLLILKLILLILAAICFHITEKIDEYYTTIIILEIFIIPVIIILYVLTVNLVPLSLDWPLLEILDHIASTIFLLLVGSMALRERRRNFSFYIGGILSFAAAIVCFVDVYLVNKNIKNREKKVLGFKDEPEKVSISPVSKTSPVSGLSKTSSKASSRASSKASSKSLSRAISAASIKE